MFKSKGRHVHQSQVEKFTRYSIRKVSFGAASVAVATGLFFLGGGSVQAAEPVINSEPTEVQNSQNLNDKSLEPSKEVAGQASATDKESDGQKTNSVKDSVTDTQASAVETPNVVPEKVSINTASLDDLVAKVESRLSQLTEDKKTKSVIDDAKNLLNKAKELGVTYPVLFDVNDRFIINYAIRSFPTHIFINSDGTIGNRIAGGVTEESLSKEIEKLK